MLFYNKNIRRKVTYKLPVIFDEVQVEKRELYSYSIFSDDFKEKEVLFSERKINIYQYNPETQFVDTLKIYDEYGDMVKRYSFSLICFEDSNLVTNRDSLVHIFKHSPVNLNKNVCLGYIDLINESDLEYFRLRFHRVDSFLGYKVEVKYHKNSEGDFFKEEYYDASTKRLLFVLLSNFEYMETELEKRAQHILQNGWD